MDHSKIGTNDAANAVKITSDNSFAEISYFTKDTETLDDDYHLIKVKNTKIYKLPSTGGRGIYWNIVIGTLIAMFFAYAGFTMRRKKERRSKT